MHSPYNSLLRFVETSDLPPTHDLSKPRRIPRPTSYSYVRLIRPGLYQARPWLGVRWIGSINLGLYRSERDAHAAVKAWVNAGADPCRGLPAKVLPKFVKERDGRYVGIVRKRGSVITTELCDTPEQAHRAMVARLDELFQRRVRRRPKLVPVERTLLDLSV